MSSAWERKERAREEKLKAIDEQVEKGTLVIRSMTKAERAENPPKPRPERPAKRRP